MLETAKRAVNICAAVKRRENVLVVTDTNKVQIAEVLAKASREVGAETVVAIMNPRDMHGNEPPKMVADIIFTPTTYSLTHTDSMDEARNEGARAIILRGITGEMRVRGGMTADYNEVRRKSETCREIEGNQYSTSIIGIRY